MSVTYSTASVGSLCSDWGTDRQIDHQTDKKGRREERHREAETPTRQQTNTHTVRKKDKQKYKINTRPKMSWVTRTLWASSQTVNTLEIKNENKKKKKERKRSGAEILKHSSYRFFKILFWRYLSCSSLWLLWITNSYVSISVSFSFISHISIFSSRVSRFDYFGSRD